MIIRINVAGSHEFNKAYGELYDKSVKDEINKIEGLMKQDEIRGDKIERKLWPKKYRDKYLINNLWRYSIGSQRLLYTIITEHDIKTYGLLDILSHDKYDKLFHYHTS